MLDRQYLPGISRTRDAETCHRQPPGHSARPPVQAGQLGGGVVKVRPAVETRKIDDYESAV